MAKAKNYGGVSGNHLRSYIERIERLEEDKKVIAEDIKEVFAEAKANGFDTKIMRKVLSLRKMDAAEREEIETLIEVYKSAIGMQSAFDFSEDDETNKAFAKKVARTHGPEVKLVIQQAIDEKSSTFNAGLIAALEVDHIHKRFKESCEAAGLNSGYIDELLEEARETTLKRPEVQVAIENLKELTKREGIKLSIKDVQGKAIKLG